ncbi:MAG: very short patch repair endonuclease [Pseudomonadota bacterium]
MAARTSLKTSLLYVTFTTMRFIGVELARRNCSRWLSQRPRHLPDTQPPMKMPDKFSPEHRSDIMSRIGQKDTKPELLVRSYLHRRGFRFRVSKRGIPGTPDLWLKKYNAAIFVHGCFWHRHKGCKRASIPTQNREKWLAKFAKNVERDASVNEELFYLGIRVLVIWDCALRTADSRSTNLSRAVSWIKSSERYLEIPYCR